MDAVKARGNGVAPKIVNRFCAYHRSGAEQYLDSTSVGGLKQQTQIYVLPIPKVEISTHPPVEVMPVTSTQCQNCAYSAVVYEIPVR